MNVIFVTCCVIALSILGKRSLRKAMIKLKASKTAESDFNNDDLSDPVNPPSSQGKETLQFYFLDSHLY